jgi:hypothetical protein
VQIICHQVVNLRGRVVEIEKLNVELINVICNNENEVMFLKRLTKRFYHHIRCLSKTIVTMCVDGDESPGTGIVYCSPFSILVTSLIWHSYLF